MAIVRMHEVADATWSRAWAIDTTAEFIAFLLTYGSPLGPKRGDVIYDAEANRSYLVINANQAVQITNLSELPIDLTGDVSGVLPVANGGTNLSSNAWNAVPYNAGDYSGSGSLVFTPAPGEVLAFEYQQINEKTNLLNITIQGFSLSGTGNQLLIDLPFTPVSNLAGPLLLADNGSLEVGFFSITGGVAVVTCFRPGTANWSASTNASSVYLPNLPIRVA